MSSVVVLFSGGLDSTVLAHKAMADGVLHSTVFATYGALASEHEQRAVDGWRKRHGYGGPSWRLPLSGVAPMNTAPGTAGPRVIHGRNLSLIAHAAGWAASSGASVVWVGATAEDAAEYPDCREGFIMAASQATRLGSGVYVAAPFIDMTKREVVQLGHELGVDMAATWSCYSPLDEDPCGKCNACVSRAAALDPRARF